MDNFEKYSDMSVNGGMTPGKETPGRAESLHHINAKNA